jgi:DNA-binding XRE family transcriptional regulator
MGDSAIMAPMTGAELRKLREAAGWTQAQVAAVCEVSWRTYARWEEGLGKKRKGKAKTQAQSRSRCTAWRWATSRASWKPRQRSGSSSGRDRGRALGRARPLTLFGARWARY